MIFLTEFFSNTNRKLGGPGGGLFACPASFFSFCYFFLFLLKIRVAGPLPPPLELSLKAIGADYKEEKGKKEFFFLDKTFPAIKASKIKIAKS